MARSRKKTPVLHWCKGSDTWARRKGNKTLRRHVKMAIEAMTDPEDFVPPEQGSVNLTDSRDWPTDGRIWWGDDAETVASYRHMGK